MTALIVVLFNCCFGDFSATSSILSGLSLIDYFLIC
jgi:hypothetical protein